MPRKAPDRVEEVRVTLGNYERAQLEQFVNSYEKDKLLENVPNLMLGVSALGYVATTGLAAYALYKFLTEENVDDIIDGIGSTTARFVDGVGRTIGFATPRASAVTGNIVTSAELSPAEDGTPPNYRALSQEVETKYNRIIAALEQRKETLESKQDNVFTFRFYREAQIITIKKQISLAKQAKVIELARIDEARSAYYANQS